MLQSVKLLLLCSSPPDYDQVASPGIAIPPVVWCNTELKAQEVSIFQLHFFISYLLQLKS